MYTLWVIPWLPRTRSDVHDALALGEHLPADDLAGRAGIAHLHQRDVVVVIAAPAVEPHVDATALGHAELAALLEAEHLGVEVV
jgi:hypothetical protein